METEANHTPFPQSLTVILYLVYFIQCTFSIDLYILLNLKVVCHYIYIKAYKKTAIEKLKGTVHAD